MRTAKLSLGGKEYEVSQLPIKPAKAWRVKFKAFVGGITDVMASFSGVKLDSVEDLGKAIPAIMGVALDKLDEVAELVLAYSPELEKDRAHIEENATDEEMIEAFMEVARLAFPLQKIVAAIPTGPTATAISKNLPSPSGDSKPKT